MIYFFSDLDNTLVYSHRVSLPGERVIAEYLNGRVQSYMTKKARDFLRDAEEIFLVPTTTRTCEQYARLSDTFSAFGCRYALVCGGGVLLDGGEVDADWLNETKEAAGDELSALAEAGELLPHLFPERPIRSGEGIMLYIRSDDPVAEAAALSSRLNTEKLNIYCDSRKIYCFPASVNKGRAVKRFASRMGISRFAAAGDGLPDVSMLCAADTAIFPRELSGLVAGERKFPADDTLCFSDFICDVLSRMI